MYLNHHCLRNSSNVTKHKILFFAIPGTQVTSRVWAPKGARPLGRWVGAVRCRLRGSRRSNAMWPIYSGRICICVWRVVCFGAAPHRDDRPSGPNNAALQSQRRYNNKLDYLTPHISTRHDYAASQTWRFALRIRVGGIRVSMRFHRISLRPCGGLETPRGKRIFPDTKRTGPGYHRYFRRRGSVSVTTTTT